VTISDPSGVVLLNNTTPCVGPPAYEDFTGSLPPVPLLPGATYNVSVTVGTWWATDQVRVWLDTDNNFSFEDVNDTMVTLTSTSGNTPSLTLSGAFTVPVSAVGGFTRLRVRLIYGAWPVPASCANATFGNTEDYGAIVGGSLPPQWQVNQPGAYMDFDGILAGPFTPAIDTKCAGAGVVACANSFGNLGDIFLNLAPIVPASGGGIVLPPNIVNLDLTAGFVQLFGTLAPIALCPVAFGAPAGTLSAQMVVLDFSSPTGLRLSQACQLTGTPGGTLTLPNADDAAYVVNIAAAPVCHPTPLPFYGTSYTQITVSTNGILSPGTLGVIAWTPTAAAAMTNPGSVGIWSDWQSNANPLATIVVNGAGAFGGVDVTYTNVPYFGTGINSTFNVGIDAAGPRIESISTLGTAATPTMIMLSLGGGVATNPGATAFALGGPFVPPNPATDMIYALGTGTPALGGGANAIWFTALSGGGYDWIGL
jgi:hypothetical protein